MLNSPIFIKKLVLMCVGVAMMLMLVTSAKADDQVTRRHEFNIADIAEVEINSTVGSIELVPVDGSEMRITLDIEADDGGFFRRRVDVDDMDITIRERGDSLYLKFDEKHANAEWYIEMPAVARTTIDLGVGELKLEIGDTELDVDLGVGDVNILAREDRVGKIKLDVGVGDADVRGGDILDNDSAFISRRIRAEGKGHYDINVDIGVGDADVRLH